MEKQFAFENIICKLGKISINLELEGDEEVVVFCVPITAAMLDAEPANAIAGDRDFMRSVYNDNKGFLEPMPWCRTPIRFPEKYDGAVATFKLPGDEVLEYKGARVKDIEQSPTPGGKTQLDFQLQIRPELDRGNLLLQEYQHREVTLSIADAKVALKKGGKQGNLPLVGGGEAPESVVAWDGRDGPTEQQRNDETQRQLGEALRGLEGGNESGDADSDEDGEADGDGESQAA